MTQAGRVEHLFHGGEIGGGHLLQLSIRAERPNVAAHVDHRFVERVAETIAGVAAHEHAARLRHERGKTAHIAFDDDVRALERDAATKSRVPADDEPTAMRGSARATAGEAAHFDSARHHVLRDARAGVPVHDHGRELIHARRVVARVALDVDANGRVEPDGDVVRAIGILDAHARNAREITVQELVRLSHAARVQVEHLAGVELLPRSHRP